MRHPIFRLLPATWALIFLFACSTSDGGDEEGPLASGHYLIQDDQDALYDFAQYFVVRPGSRWEFVEYGVRRSDGTVCQVTRSRGRYGVSDTLIALTGTEGGESLEKCPITQADFDGYTWEAAPAGASESFSFRNPTDSSFEARNMFEGVTGWRTYRRAADPHGYFD
jgi:hypothetical protein